MPLAFVLPLRKGQYAPIVVLAVLFFCRTEPPPEPITQNLSLPATAELVNYLGAGKWVAELLGCRVYLTNLDTGYPGQIISATFLLHPLRGARFPGEFDYSRYSAKQGITATAKTQGPVEVLDTVDRPFEQLQFAAVSKVTHWPLATPQIAFVQALCLGWRGALDRATKGVFATTGLMHVLAVSGLHIGLLQLGLHLAFFFVPLRWRRWWVVALLWGFALLTGASASICRATALFTWMALAGSLGRKTNATNGLFGVGLLLLAVHPGWVADVGFWLSFIAVWSLLRYVPAWGAKFSKRGKVMRWLWTACGVSSVAQLATLPITGSLFGRLPLYFLLTNLLLLPLVPLLMGLGTLGLLFPDQPPMAWIRVLEFFLEVFFGVAHQVASWPYAELAIRWNGPQTATIALLCLLALETLRSGLRLRSIQFICAALGLWALAGGIDNQLKQAAFGRWELAEASACLVLVQKGPYAQRSMHVNDNLYQTFLGVTGLRDAGYCACDSSATARQ